MRLAVAALLFASAVPFARASAVRPEGPVSPPPVETRTQTPAPKPVPAVPIAALPKKIKKNKAFIAALPQPEDPPFSVPLRTARLLPEPDEEPEADDAYLDLFLNEEAEDLP